MAYAKRFKCLRNPPILFVALLMCMAAQWAGIASGVATNGGETDLESHKDADVDHI